MAPTTLIVADLVHDMNFVSGRVCVVTVNPSNQVS